MHTNKTKATVYRRGNSWHFLLIIAALTFSSACSEQAERPGNTNTSAGNTSNSAGNTQTAQNQTSSDGERVGRREETRHRGDENREKGFIEGLKDRLLPRDRPIVITGGSISVMTPATPQLPNRRIRNEFNVESQNTLVHKDVGDVQRIVIERWEDNNTWLITTYTLPAGTRCDLKFEYAGNAEFLALNLRGSNKLRVVSAIPFRQYGAGDTGTPAGDLNVPKIKYPRYGDAGKITNFRLWCDVRIEEVGKPDIPADDEIPHPVANMMRSHAAYQYGRQ